MGHPVTLLGYEHERTDLRAGMHRLLATLEPSELIVPLNQQTTEHAHDTIAELDQRLRITCIAKTVRTLIRDRLTHSVYPPVIDAALAHARAQHVRVHYALPTYDSHALRALEHHAMQATYAVTRNSVTAWAQEIEPRAPLLSKQERLRRWDVLIKHESTLCNEYHLWRTRKTRHDLALAECTRSHANADRLIVIAPIDHLYNSMFGQTLYSKVLDLQPRRVPFIE